MSDALLRQTIRRCTALLLVVLGAIAVELASIEYPNGGNFVGGAAMFSGTVYLAWSAFDSMAEQADPARSAAGDTDGNGDGDGSSDDADDGPTRPAGP